MTIENLGTLGMVCLGAQILVGWLICAPALLIGLYHYSQLKTSICNASRADVHRYRMHPDVCVCVCVCVCACVCVHVYVYVCVQYSVYTSHIHTEAHTRSGHSTQYNSSSLLLCILLLKVLDWWCDTHLQYTVTQHKSNRAFQMGQYFTESV